MVVAAKRFKVLDTDMNVAPSDFFNPSTSDIFNSPNNELKKMSSSLESFLQKGKSDLLKKIKPDGDSAIRAAKGAFGSLKDLSKISAKDIDGKIADELLGSSPLAASAFKKLSSSCRTGPMKHFNSGKPFDSNINCGGKSRKGKSGGCSVSGYSNVINALTDGEYSAQYKNLNQTLSNIVSLASMGYNMNLCGVFSALTKDAGGMVKSRAASMLLGSLGSSKNLRGVFDLAKSAVGKDFHILRELPSGVGGVLNNLKIPFDAKEAEFSQLNESISLSMESFDPGWNKSSYDDSLSVASVDEYSEDYDDILKSSSTDHDVSEDNLDEIPNKEDAAFRSAYIAKAKATEAIMSANGARSKSAGMEEMLAEIALLRTKAGLQPNPFPRGQ